MFRLHGFDTMEPIPGTTFGAYWGRWNCPEFDRDAVQRIMDWDNAPSRYEKGSWWSGDVAVFGGLEGVERYEPNTGTGLWSIGAGAWEWEEVEPTGNGWGPICIDPAPYTAF